MKKIVAVAVIVCAFIAVAGFWAVWHPGTASDSGRQEPVTIGVPKLESSLPMYVAAERHYFEKNGLDVTIQDYNSGIESTNAMLRGEADLAAPSEFMIVTNALNNESIRGIASFDKAQYIYLIGRKDRGIQEIADLRGKTVGANRDTIGEFYLNRFLVLHGMEIGDVVLVDAKVPQAVEMITRGDVDAVAVIQPYASTIRERLGDDAVVWEVQSNQPLFAVVVSTDEWISAHADLVPRFLRSIDEANGYIISNPSEAKTIVTRRLNISDAYAETVLQQNQFSPTLDQSLVLAMEDEARWMIQNNLTNATAMPDFREYLSTEGLESVKPGSVNVIR